MIRFGVSAGHGGTAMLSGARELCATLTRTLHERVRLVVAEDYERLLSRLLADDVELAWLPPLLHTRAVRGGAALAVISEREGALTYRSALLVRADSPLERVADLRDLRVAWTDPHSAAGHLVPRKHLQAVGCTFVEETFAGSTLAACEAVADGRADLCACFVSEAAATEPARVLADVSRVYAPAAWRLRALDVTEAIPSDGVLFAPGVSADAAAFYLDGLTRLHDHEHGRSALRALMSATRLVKARR